MTVLNVDYKLASKVIAKRIECLLQCVMRTNQSGFMKSRFIGQNVLLVRDILQQTKLREIPGILLCLNFQKPFDTVGWSFIQETLSLFKFGSSIKRWTLSFYTNAES